MERIFNNLAFVSIAFDCTKRDIEQETRVGFSWERFNFCHNSEPIRSSYIIHHALWESSAMNTTVKLLCNFFTETFCSFNEFRHRSFLNFSWKKVLDLFKTFGRTWSVVGRRWFSHWLLARCHLIFFFFWGWQWGRLGVD